MIREQKAKEGIRIEVLETGVRARFQFLEAMAVLEAGDGDKAEYALACLVCAQHLSRGWNDKEAEKYGFVA
jgi:hypothetical protein